MPAQTTQAITQLTAPGASGFVRLRNGSRSKFARVTVAAINTSVTIRLEYANLASSTITNQTVDQLITANGSYIIPIYDVEDRIRINFVAEAGGTTATIDTQIIELSH